jgi:hypothetical protein
MAMLLMPVPLALLILLPRPFLLVLLIWRVYRLLSRVILRLLLLPCLMYRTSLALEQLKGDELMSVLMKTAPLMLLMMQQDHLLLLFGVLQAAHFSLILRLQLVQLLCALQLLVTLSVLHLRIVLLGLWKLLTNSKNLLKPHSLSLHLPW